jgi:2-succinyl-6-hydroxy-2,4-cyclohexadiene-1-carboxylate synthase
MPNLQINDVSYYFEAHGAGRPLLLLHGFTGSSQNWLPLIPALAEKYRVIALDLLGHGRTDSPLDECRYTMEKSMADLMAMVDELGYSDVGILGYSMGGRLALGTAVTYPQRVNTLILESASPGLATEIERQERITRDRELADWIEANGIEPFVNRWEQLSLWASQQQLPEEARQKLHQQRLQNNPVGLAKSLRGLGSGAQPSFWKKLNTLPMPVLLIAGELDEKFATINQQMATQIPNARLELVTGVGHTVHLERPNLFAEFILSFPGNL